MERFDIPDAKIALLREDSGIYLNICGTQYPELERERLIRVSLVVDNKYISAVKWHCAGDVLTLSCSAGSVKFRFLRPDCVQILGTGRLSLRFHIENLRQFENGCPREDGGIEVAYVILGKLLFVPVKGALWHNAMWQPREAKSTDFIIDLLPSAETGVFEAAVHEYFSNGVRDVSYPPFE